MASMKIYTKTGDAGETGLLGGKRVRKDTAEIAAIGTVDELNSALGVLVASVEGDEKLVGALRKIQHSLFVVGGQLAAVQTKLVSVPELSEAIVTELENWIDELTVDLPELTQFILPGGTAAAAQAFWVRAICRRAEREVVSLTGLYPNLLVAQRYLNRLSDAFFVFARWLNVRAGQPEIFWEK